MWSVRVKKTDFWLAIFLFATTVLVYWPSLHGGLLWDDAAHVTKPELQSISGLSRIWFELGATQQYYPVLHSAFWLEHRLWGDSTLGYHVLNVVLHSAAACLFALILSQLSVKGVWGPAFMFALHPISVESVAWISEQKNTLSAVFYLVAALLYLRHDNQTQNGAWRPTPAYFISFASFVAAILCKSVTVTLPAALLVILWWERGKLSWSRDVLPLIPWFAAGIGGGLFTAWVEQRFVGAVGDDFSFSAVQRGLIAGRAILFYLGKIFWPSRLMFIYPRWEVNSSVWWQYLFPAGAVVLFTAAWLIRRKSRAPLAALLFFGGSLFPALGFVNVYPFIFSFVADHFQYLPSMGVIALAAALCRNKWLQAGTIATAGILGILSWFNCVKYLDVETLYQTTIRENPICWMCYNNLGVIRLSQSRFPEAKDNFEAALRIRPRYPEAQYNLGTALISLGRAEEAMPHLQKAVQLTPDYGEAMLRVGSLLLKAKRFEDAIRDIKEGERLKPNDPEAHRLLGEALRSSGQFMQAKIEAEEALRLKPDSASFHNDLAVTLESLKQPEEAQTHFLEALRLKPDYADAHYNLGLLLVAQGRHKDGMEQFKSSLRLDPTHAEYHDALGAALFQAGQYKEAVVEFVEAERLKPNLAGIRNNLELARRAAASQSR
jgi:tetratricopeptide (TPR) repeat protein